MKMTPSMRQLIKEAKAKPTSRKLRTGGIPDWVGPETRLPHPEHDLETNLMIKHKGGETFFSSKNQEKCVHVSPAGNHFVYAIHRGEGGVPTHVKLTDVATDPSYTH
jgi:hypothetical protein